MHLQGVLRLMNIIINYQRLTIEKKNIKFTARLGKIKSYLILEIFGFASPKSGVQQLCFLEDCVFLGLIKAIHLKVSVSTKWSAFSCLC